MMNHPREVITGLMVGHGLWHGRHAILGVGPEVHCTTCGAVGALRTQDSCMGPEHWSTDDLIRLAAATAKCGVLTLTIDGDTASVWMGVQWPLDSWEDGCGGPCEDPAHAVNQALMAAILEKTP